ncbi:sialidase domain-containing protein [Staphylococcus pseudintermedius]|uniref:sialidase family protein n=2 Tax=Staphylococcus pseudintermedius TaxID=283734 RepID=UPI0008061469|nr:exo-alpha-sialidase [Staphylococcus pseudintermedius]ANQ82112.1 sialidase [Staphylococcus pseudintermedius]EGQ0379205.1 sialidase [Staphylococcus pseudintermedius]EGQ0385486.1 sialidase [Staphylococcus pseudintermedius]EGQ1302502.1 sialidase [Staphylococcus pseudintermedius]EGQ1624932.1 sialidase [Staphylococcus pseudintermedius]
MRVLKVWIYILSLLLIIGLVTPNAFAQVAGQKNGNEANTLVFEKDNIQLAGNGMNITSGALNKLTGPDFTVIIKYHQLKPDGIQALFGISNSKKGNPSSYLDMYVRENGELGMEARDTNTKTNHLVSRPASVWGKYKNKPASNIVALVLNHYTKTYSLFSNGYKVEEKKINNFLMLSNINGLDSFVIGGVNREGKNSFGFNGTIENIKIFNNALDENTIKSMTKNDITQRLIYKANDETHSNYFRIPSLYTLSNGRVLSSIDARYGGTHDFLNKINIATSYSDDNGNSWTKPKLTLSFDDFESVPLEWPRDPGKRDWQISGGATYIDSVLLEKKDKQVMLFADVMPAGVSFREAVRNDSGFKKINEKYYLKLKKSGENDYQYTVRENGIIYDDRTNKPTEYSVDKNFAISKNNKKLKVEQYSAKVINGQKTEFKNGKFVDMNVFYKDALFKVVPTNFIAYSVSDNFGTSWTKPTLIPSLLGDKHNSPYLGPGRGIVEHSKGRILIPSYTGKDSVFIYSDDNGRTWKTKIIPLPSSWSAEAQIIELQPGVLQAYMRTNNGKIAFITSKDAGNTWSNPNYLDFISNPNYGTELSIINYSQKIDGKNAVILSTPNSKNGRRNGQIWIGLLGENNKVEWRYHHDVDYSQYGFSYSTLTELPNHDIGLMYEKFDSWSRNELHIKNVIPYVSYKIEDLKNN